MQTNILALNHSRSLAIKAESLINQCHSQSTLRKLPWYPLNRRWSDESQGDLTNSHHKKGYYSLWRKRQD
jgi:hypothetical protein